MQQYHYIVTLHLVSQFFSRQHFLHGLGDGGITYAESDCLIQSCQFFIVEEFVITDLLDLFQCGTQRSIFHGDGDLREKAQ